MRTLRNVCLFAGALCLVANLRSAQEIGSWCNSSPHRITIGWEHTSRFADLIYLDVLLPEREIARLIEFPVRRFLLNRRVECPRGLQQIAESR